MMNTQFQYIVQLAAQYRRYSGDTQLLLHGLNQLPQHTLEQLVKEYGNPDNKLKPVNLLRAQIARLLLQGHTITEAGIEEVKTNIRTKNLVYFEGLPEHFLEQLRNYPTGKRDMFANWQKHWRVFHTFFFHGIVKDTVRLYLEQISRQMLLDLGLRDYDYHWVDFYGPSNFGSDRCWIALFPIDKESHRDAYQFFLSFEMPALAGRAAGHGIKHGEPNKLETVSSYEQAITLLEHLRTDITARNRGIRNYFKFTPGTGASEWNSFYEQGIAAIDFSKLGVGNLAQYNSLQDINLAAGLEADNSSNQTWNLWLFLTANTGDVIFANKGLNTCIGIGIIEGAYRYEPGANYANRRKVNWITDKVYHYKPGALQGYSALFRPDTFSPTKVKDFLLGEYLRIYPELAPVFSEYGLVTDGQLYKVPYFSEPDRETGIIEADTGEEPSEEIIAETEEGINYWWINANPRIWQINSHVLGQRQTYITDNERDNKRRVYKHFESIKPGDMVIGYESSPARRIKALYKVTKGIHQTEKGEEIEFELMDKLEVPVHWNELKNIPGLRQSEVLINNQGSLFRLTEEEYDILREIIDDKNTVADEWQSGERPVKKYRFQDDEDRLFIQEGDFEKAVELLKKKKNIILQGPPGVGKTFIARKLAYAVLQEENDGQIETVQFHQSYSYEDFVQGLRPTPAGGFDVKDGSFYAFCQRAHAHPDRDFFFIIDEINRGNLSKIFGELMMLVEHDKRYDKYKLKLTYAQDEKDRFFVPPNLHIIGTMNTADRSLAMVDYALRRRFAFISLYPDFGAGFRDFLAAQDMSSALIAHICNRIEKINRNIQDDPNLGTGFQIGHSYFCTYKPGDDEQVWWSDILKYELQPLLEEIWFDDNNLVQSNLEQLKIQVYAHTGQ